MKKFTEWLMEGKKKLSPGVKAFISGKSDSVKLDIGPTASGPQTQSFRTGAHDSRPRKERTRSGQEKKWKKEED